MTIYNPEGNHTKYTEIDRHFCAKSEQYTGADSLITAQRNGWQIINTVYEKKVEMRGGRYTSLYYFKLMRNGDKLIMPIVSSPFIERMLQRTKIVLLPLERHTYQDIERKTSTFVAINDKERV